MASAYDDAASTLYRAPLASFVAERKRLAGELKAAGDKDGAARLGKLARPPISAWAVNQLHWQARAELDAMFETAARLRAGQLDATAAHRDAIAALRARAAALLEAAGHTPNEATLRRVTTTLAALAATGGFDPDPPGALSEDRDPPGFAGVGIVAPRPAAATPTAPAATAPRTGRSAVDDAREREAAAAARRKQREEERTRTRLARARLADALKSAQHTVTARARDVDAARGKLVAAETAAAEARATVATIEAELAAIDQDDGNDGGGGVAA